MRFSNRLLPLRWSPSSLSSAVRAGMPNVPGDILAVRYPFRLLRYWFMHQFMVRHASSAAHPLSVAEVGVDHGQQLSFAAANRESPWWYRWDAYDVSPRTETLLGTGYSHVIAADLDDPRFGQAHTGRHYDVVIALHVLEHVRSPEAAVHRLAAMLKPGGMLIGGGPVTPEAARHFWERRLRRRAKPGGHISVLSPQRLSDMASASGLTREWQGGAFLVRCRGFVLENFRWWLRVNLLFGALLPSWPGEIYFAWRRPLDASASADASIIPRRQAPVG